MKMVCIIIPAFRRPRLLAKCLNSIAFLHMPPHVKASLIVIDNDPEQSAKPVIDSLKDFPMPVFYDYESVRGGHLPLIGV